MANRRFEMYEYRRVLVLMRQGASDRSSSRARLMGREKAKEVRAVAEALGWLERDQALPEDGDLARVFRGSPRVATPSTLEPYREFVEQWHREGLKKTTRDVPGCIEVITVKWKEFA